MWNLNTDNAWKFYGKEAPYYGVFGYEKYLNDNLDDTLFHDFFVSGTRHVDTLFNTIRNKIDPDFKPENILDFGCGPGRLLIPFSKFATQVTGIDISEGMIDEARENCLKFNVNNAVFHVSDDELKCIDGCSYDLINSYIVLQHLKTSRGERLVKRLVKALSPDGVGALHFTYHDNYPGRWMINLARNNIPFMSFVFRAVRLLMTRKKTYRLPQMNMYNYDLNRIYQILQSNNIREVYSYFTNHYNYHGIVLIFKKHKV